MSDFKAEGYWPGELEPPKITLRDWFAGQALSGLCSGFTGGDGDPEWFEQIGCKSAYRIADSMLAARGAA